MPFFADKRAQQKVWESIPFFAFEKGYQLCLNVYAAGHQSGKGTHVSAYIHLMKGPHDHKLQTSNYFPLKGKFTLELLNQLDNANHISKVIVYPVDRNISSCDNATRVTTGKMNLGCGYHQFISHTALLKNDANINYVADGSLYFRVWYSEDTHAYHGDGGELQMLRDQRKSLQAAMHQYTKIH